MSDSSLSDSSHESAMFPPFTPAVPSLGGSPKPAKSSPGNSAPVEEVQDFEEFEEVDQFEEIPSRPTSVAPPKPAPSVRSPAVAASPVAPTPLATVLSGPPQAAPTPPVKAPTASVSPPVKSPVAVAPPVTRPAAPAAKPSPKAEPSPEELLEEIAEHGGSGFGVRRLIRNSSSMTVSMVVHLIGLMIMAMWVTDPVVVRKLHEIVASAVEEPEKKEELTVELEKQLTEVTEQTNTSFSSSMDVSEAIGASGPVAGAQQVEPLDKALLEQMVKADDVTVEGLFIDTPSSRQLIVQAPDGQVGDARAVVDDYNEALDRITQEILWMLEKGPVLVVWAFDQSESMKDDQKEIRDRIEHVYKQLGLVSKSNREALETAVVSYGEGYIQHTRKPTSDWYEIKACIDEVPNDPSGKEMMCSAVTQAIGTHRAYAQKTNRQMCLILCTDESGEQQDNQSNLERAVAEAKAAACKIYVIGREAIFGYPYAHIRWIHPQTGHHHWIRIDRGPETAFVEQLQTDGFRRRYDAHNSGFGPYEQTRMSHESGGIFFMLPSLESALVRGEKRRYELEAMRMYLPDIRTRMEVGKDIEDSELRRSLTKVIYDLNPYNPEAAKIIEMRVEFSPDLPNLFKQINIECAKATIYGEYLSRVEVEMQRLEKFRRHESSPRWQANYDLIYAQVIAYQARMFEYRAYLLEFAKNPRFVPPTKPPNLTHTGWDIHTRKQIITGKVVEPYIERATAMFNAVMTDHPGTPWAARAEYELKRGFGVHLIEEYHGPYKTVPPGTAVIPVPKM
ncbi:VWA domain-containing protein [Anatilimnocola sp. NA78]|uniref:VWA domain-containing protein n=1 Tax=Anatilimnocola sp. NA78 TaxID=3415683 RepID=UPI003CE5776F